MTETSACQHRRIRTYLEFADDEYYSAVAKSVEESRKLIEDGWEYVTDMEDYKIFRKPK